LRAEVEAHPESIEFVKSRAPVSVDGAVDLERPTRSHGPRLR